MQRACRSVHRAIRTSANAGAPDMRIAVLESGTTAPDS
jgi:hypothetical protein